MMWCSTVIVLLTFVEQAYANATASSTDTFADELVEKLVDKLLDITSPSKYSLGNLNIPRSIPSTYRIPFGRRESHRNDRMLKSYMNDISPYAAERTKAARAVPTGARVAGSSIRASTQPEVVLYGSQGSRSPLVNWAMYELGVEFTMGDLGKNPHPFGQIPSLKVGDATLFESGAILTYLQNMFGKETNEALKATIISWIVWANASLDPICFLETPEGKVYDTGLKNPKQKRMLALDDMLSKRQYIASDEFSTADVAIASYLLYVVQFFPNVNLAQWTHVVAYMIRCAERPAYGKAFGDQVQGFLVQSLKKQLEDGPEKKGLFGMR